MNKQEKEKRVEAVVDLCRKFYQEPEGSYGGNCQVLTIKQSAWMRDVLAYTLTAVGEAKPFGPYQVGECAFREQLMGGRKGQRLLAVWKTRS